MAHALLYRISPQEPNLPLAPPYQPLHLLPDYSAALPEPSFTSDKCLSKHYNSLHQPSQRIALARALELDG